VQLDCVRRDAGLTVLVVEEGDAGCALGQILATASAFRICRRRYAVAPVVQSGEPVSPIIVCLPAAQDEMVVEVASVRSSVTAAVTVKIWRSKGSRAS
jgi:hypothetical protein